MINKKIIQNIRNHEMNREEFLKYAGVVLVGAVSIKTALNLPGSTPRPRPSSTKVTTSASSFGGGKFGA